MGQTGKLVVVSAPSGAGKTTLIRRVLARFPNLSYSVSHTTRAPRQGEIHARDYFFVDEETFKSLIDGGEMLEWARVHNHYYGTSRSAVTRTLEKGKSVLLDIDVQGAGQIMNAGLTLVSIFIMAPSPEVLRERLEKRGTDTAGVIALRLKNAEEEIAQKGIYDYVVVNDDLETAVSDLCAIFEKEVEPV